MIDNKIIFRIGLASCVIAVLLLSSGISYAHSEKKIVLYLNYKNQQQSESLSLLNAYVIEGRAPDYSSQPKEGYKVQIVAYSRQILKSFMFDVPQGSLAMPGITKQYAGGTENDLKFTLDLPYFADAEIINIYNKNGNSILQIPIESFYVSGKNKNVIKINGYFIAIIIDDFEHPENSRAETYLDVEGKKYYLTIVNPTNARPGDFVHVKGIMIGDRIIAEEVIKTDEKPVKVNENQQIEQSKQSLYKYRNKIPNVSLVLALIIIILLLLKLSKRKTKLDDIDSELDSYIKDSLKKGFTKQQIRKALMKNDYTTSEIDKAFKEAK